MRRTFPPNLSEVTTRVYETMAWCSLKPLTAEAPYDGPLLIAKYRDENWSFAQLRSHCILGNQLRSLELKPTAEGAKWADDPSLSHQQIGKMVRAMLGTEL
jgi:hypothetical protein